MDLDLLDAAVRDAAQVDVTAMSDEALCDAAVRLRRQASQHLAAEGRILAELDARGVCRREFGSTTATWQARETLTKPAGCQRRLHVAVALRDRFPHVAAALAAGEVSWDHADTLVRLANPRIWRHVAAVQAALLADARGGGTFRSWEIKLRNFVTLVDENGPFDPNDALERNRMRISGSGDSVLFSGELHGEHALILRQALDARTNKLFRQFRRDHLLDPSIALPSRPTLRALALAELITEALAATTPHDHTNADADDDADDDAEPSDDAPLHDHRRDDHRDDHTGSPNDQGGAKRKPRWRRPRTEATLVIRAEDPTSVYDPAGVLLQDDTVRRLLCDADWLPLIVDRLGVPLDMGRLTRYATPAQRTMVAVRDGGCVFPGCDKPVDWCDIHHVNHFSQGGATNVATMACLCRTHHGITHRRGWSMHTTNDGWFWWQTPTGRTFWSQRNGKPRNNPPPNPQPPTQPQHTTRPPPPHHHRAA
jgi:hypothetical protein